MFLVYLLAMLFLIYLRLLFALHFHDGWQPRTCLGLIINWIPVRQGRT